MRYFLAVAVALLIAGCDVEPSETMISPTSNVPPSYRVGFNDGCHSGRQAAGALFEDFRKDQVRFNQDRDYAQGWSDAFRQCETQEEQQQRAIRSAQTINAINSAQERRFDNVLRGVDYSGVAGLKASDLQ
ncbi:MAG: hypothetical protein AAF968_08780 [Pseudomonadota bacterium]